MKKISTILFVPHILNTYYLIQNENNTDSWQTRTEKIQFKSTEHESSPPWHPFFTLLYLVSIVQQFVMGRG